MRYRSVKIWNVAFGNNFTNVNVVADTVEEAIDEAKIQTATEFEDCEDEKWVSKIELQAEADVRIVGRKPHSLIMGHKR